MKSNYCHLEARNVSGRDFGFEQVDRVSELTLLSARPIEWHAHKESEIICCLKGALTYEFENRLDVTLTSGCFLVIPRGLRHRLSGGIDGPCRRISLFLNSPQRRLSRKSPFSHSEYRDVLADILRCRLVAKAFSETIRQQLVKIADLTAVQLTPRERLEIKVFTAAVLLSFASAKTAKKANAQVRLIDEALHWMEARYHEKVTLDQLVAYMGYGKSRFCALFKERTGLPPLEWLIRYRIEKASEFLRQEQSSITEIAHRVGFDNPSFFTRIFRRRTGFSPNEFRSAAQR